MDEPFFYRTEAQIGCLDVRALSRAGDVLWAGTAEGLFRLNPDVDLFQAVDLGEDAGRGAAVVDLTPKLDGCRKYIRRVQSGCRGGSSRDRRSRSGC